MKKLSELPKEDQIAIKTQDFMLLISGPGHEARIQHLLYGERKKEFLKWLTEKELFHFVFIHVPWPADVIRICGSDETIVEYGSTKWIETYMWDTWIRDNMPREWIQRHKTDEWIMKFMTSIRGWIDCMQTAWIRANFEDEDEKLCRATSKKWQEDNMDKEWIEKMAPLNLQLDAEENE